MGTGASADASKQLADAKPEELEAVVASMSADTRAKLATALGCGDSGGTNQAFVFIKPHAVTDKVKELAKAGLEKAGITIKSEGSLDGATIDSKQLIDNHYYAIAAKATIKKPSELNVPNDKFKAKFDIDWQAALDSGEVFNALDGCKEFGCDADGMAEAWVAAQKAEKLVKLGGGFYCGRVTVGEKELYIMNGFFMAMRAKFTKPEASIYYYEVEWDSSVLSWSDFRGKVLGPTDPKEGAPEALRRQIFDNWEALGLPGEPTTGDNGMHASASPFEGLAERCNWLSCAVQDDGFGKQLLAAGMKEEMIKEWSVDPQVNVEAETKGSIFDVLEDKDCAECLKKLVELSKIN